MNIRGKKEYKTQLFFTDDNRFRFVKRQLEYSCLVEKDHGELYRAWKHFYANQFYFPGYKNISADTVTLGFSRDIILDPFDKVPVGDLVSEKPKIKEKGSLKKWIATMAENQRHIYRTQRKNTFKDDFVNYCLMGVLTMMSIVWMISFLKGINGG